MKNIILLLLFIASGLMAAAQATMEHTYNAIDYANPVDFSSNGEKLFAFDTTGVYLYNMDRTPWKTIIPAPHPGYRIATIYGVSDNFFNSDSAIEVIVCFAATSTNLFPRYKSDLVGETGATIRRIDTVKWYTMPGGK
jgi:hypothetical protein